MIEYVDIYGNQEKFTILAVACWCSCEGIQTIVANRFNLMADELLFFSKTFESVSSGAWQVEKDELFEEPFEGSFLRLVLLRKNVFVIYYRTH